MNTLEVWYVGWQTEADDIKPYLFTNWLAAKHFLLSELIFVYEDTGKEVYRQGAKELDTLEKAQTWEYWTSEAKYYISHEDPREIEYASR